MEEKILTWNLPNVISVMLMIVLLWTVIGAASHVFWRKPRAKAGNTSGTNSAGYAYPVGAA